MIFKRYIFLFFIITVNAYNYDKYKEERMKNKEFWDILNIRSITNTASEIDAYIGEKICFTCPVDREGYHYLIKNGLDNNNIHNDDPPARLQINWNVKKSNLKSPICKNNEKSYIDTSNKMEKLYYTCNDDKLCINNIKLTDPSLFTCQISTLEFEVKINKKVNARLLFQDLYMKYFYI